MKQEKEWPEDIHCTCCRIHGEKRTEPKASVLEAKFLDILLSSIGRPLLVTETAKYENVVKSLAKVAVKVVKQKLLGQGCLSCNKGFMEEIEKLVSG